MYEVDRIAGIHRKNSDSMPCMTSLAHEEWGVPDGLCAFDGDGHWWVCLDYRKCGAQGEPSITHYDTEFERECEIAPSFGIFVNGLVFGEEDFLFAIDDPDLDREMLHQIMKGIGCRKHSLSKMSKAERAKHSAWVFPGHRSGIGFTEHAYLVVHPNGDEDDPRHLARPGQHPLLHVSVLEKDQSGCIRAIAEALGDRASLIHHPFDRKPIKGLEVSDKKPPASKRSSEKSAKSNLIERAKPDKKNQMEDAIENNDANKVRKLLEAGVNPNGRTKYGIDSFLTEASLNGRTALVILLLEHADEIAKDGRLKLAIASCKPSIAKLLIEAGIEPGPRELLQAVEGRNRSNVRILLEHGVIPTPHCVRSAAGVKDLGQYGVKNRDVYKIILRSLRNAWTKPINGEMRKMFDKV